MSAIPPAVQQVLQARQDATRSEINTAILGKSLNAQKQMGDAINQMLSDAAMVQKQLNAGRLDVRV